MVARILASETDSTITGEQEPFTDKAEACAAAFHDSGVSGQCQAGDGGVAIAFDADRDDVEAGQVVLADGVESLGESFLLPLGEHVGEEPDVIGASPAPCSPYARGWSLPLGRGIAKARGWGGRLVAGEGDLCLQ